MFKIHIQNTIYTQNTYNKNLRPRKVRRLRQKVTPP